MFDKNKITLAPKVLPKELIETGYGKWVHPYIHSVPENFNATTAQWYRDFTIDHATEKLRGKARRMMNNLINYYKNLEKKFMKDFEYTGSHKEFQKDAINFTQDFAAGYKKAMVSPKYKKITELLELLSNVEKIDQNLGTMQSEVLERIVRDQIKRAKFKPGKAKKFKNQQRIVLTQAEGLLWEIMKAYNIANPTETIDIILQSLAAGGDVRKATGKLKEAIEVLKKVVPEIDAMLTFLVQTANTQTAKGKARQKTPAGVVANTFGVLNESIVGDVIVSMISGAANEVPRLFTKIKKGKVSYKPVGTKDKGGNITDTAIYMENQKGEVYNFGVDVKFHLKNTEKSRRTYERGGRQSVEAVEVLELAPIKDVAAMIYLMTNSYFMGADDQGDYYNTFLGGHDGEIFKLFNIILGLYGLLPPDTMFTNAAVKPEAIEQLVVRDNRMFITINENMYLMSLFLQKVKDQVIGAGIGSMGKPIRGLKANFEKIMEEWKSAAGGTIKKSIPPTGLYEKKVQFLMEHLNSQKDGRTKKFAGYKKLKSEVVDQITSTKLYDWKYKIKRFEYVLPKK